ncbi:septal ring lytic transglycosylase RlpA family lipoprotein, partial [Actinomadura sp. NPDC049753]
MGSPIRRRLRARLRTILIVSGAAVAVLAVGAFALAGRDGSADSAQAAQTAPQAADPLADRPHGEPTRADRGRPRTPEPSPSKTPKKGRKKSSKADAQVAKLAKRKKKRDKVVESGSCEASYYWEGQMTASG